VDRALSSNSLRLTAISLQQQADQAPISEVRGLKVCFSQRPVRAHRGESPMITRITLALALVFAAMATVPASAGPRTCGSQTFQYDNSGATVGPYCD
jgi:hypothetical protein